LLLKDTVEGFIDDGALSRGASIAYFTLFSIAPVLLVVVAIAGLAFGHDAAEGAIVAQLSTMMGGRQPRPCSKWSKVPPSPAKEPWPRSSASLS
jgi:uncharacterized BrkB/YihY/UPF0761 family membrane protein